MQAGSSEEEKGKVRGGRLRLPSGPDVTQTDPKVGWGWGGRCPRFIWKCVVVVGLGTTRRALVNPWVAEKKGWPKVMGSSLRGALSGEGVDKMGAGLQWETGQWVTWPCIIPRDTLARLRLSCTPQVPLQRVRVLRGAQAHIKHHCSESPWLSLLPISGLPDSAARAHTVLCHCIGRQLPPGKCDSVVLRD